MYLFFLLSLPCRLLVAHRFLPKKSLFRVTSDQEAVSPFLCSPVMKSVLYIER